MPESGCHSILWLVRVSCTAAHRIIVRSRFNIVVMFSACDGVISGIPIEFVRLRLAINLVSTASAPHCVIVCACIDGICRRPAHKGIIAAIAVENTALCSREDDIGVAVALDRDSLGNILGIDGFDETVVLRRPALSRSR